MELGERLYRRIADSSKHCKSSNASFNDALVRFRNGKNFPQNVACLPIRDLLHYKPFSKHLSSIYLLAFISLQ